MASKNDKVVLALIGAGGRGTQVILSMQKCTPGVEVKYVCEVDEERGGRAIDELEKQNHKIAVLGNYSQENSIRIANKLKAGNQKFIMLGYEQGKPEGIDPCRAQTVVETQE